MLDKADGRRYTETPIMMTQIPTNPPHRYWWRFSSTETDTFLTETFQSGQECVQP